jgi:DNA-binding protein
MAKETTEKEKAEEKKSDENVVYVGNKPPMSYVMAVVSEFGNSDSDEIVLKARGGLISKAVDVAEIVRNRFIKDAEVKDIIISTETVTNREGRTTNVSSMEIILAKKKSG